jgi:DNA-binding NarL/FixJ family response regulator
MENINILIVDDHQMIRDGIKASLVDVSNISVVAEAENGESALRMLAEYPEIDVVVMDISLGDDLSGINVTQQILAQYPDKKILALSMHDEKSYITKMLDAGVLGYVLKDKGMDELVDAICAVARGENYFSQGVTVAVLQELIKNRSRSKKSSHFTEQLTRREQEVLVLIANEYSNAEIAERLFISLRTVDTHRRNLILKLKVKNTAGLVRYAIKHSLINI